MKLFLIDHQDLLTLNEGIINLFTTSLKMKNNHTVCRISFISNILLEKLDITHIHICLEQVNNYLYRYDQFQQAQKFLSNIGDEKGRKYQQANILSEKCLSFTYLSVLMQNSNSVIKI